MNLYYVIHIRWYSAGAWIMDRIHMRVVTASRHKLNLMLAPNPSRWLNVTFSAPSKLLVLGLEEVFLQTRTIVLRVTKI